MKSGEVVAGRYRLSLRLGVGGMGEVWQATHDSTGREFALKFMHAHAATSESARERFARESRASARINHPNVIDVFDAGSHDDGTLYMAMELLDGISLADALHLNPPLTARDLLVLMYDTARALEAAHAVGVVHRDIKPGNIYLHRDRSTGLAAAKVLDFGISKFGGADDGSQTKTDAVLGSPRYMSPEQTRSSANVDPRTDLWSCGVMLFEALTGRWPHGGDSFSSLVLAICTEPPESIDTAAPDLPPEVRAIVRDCLLPRDQRIQSATVLANRIAVALQDPSLATRPLPPLQHGVSETRKIVTGMRVRSLLLTTTDRSTAETHDMEVDALRVTRVREASGRIAVPVAPPPVVAAPKPAPTTTKMPVATTKMPVVSDPAQGPVIEEPTTTPIVADPTTDTMAATTVRETTTGLRPAQPAIDSPSAALFEPRFAPPSRARVGAALAGIIAAVVVGVGAVVTFSSSGDTPSATPGAPSVAPTETASAVVAPPPEVSAVPKPTAEPSSAPTATTPTASATVAAVSAPRATPPRAAPPPPPRGGSKVKQLGSGL